MWLKRRKKQQLSTARPIFRHASHILFPPVLSAGLREAVPVRQRGRGYNPEEVPGTGNYPNDLTPLSSSAPIWLVCFPPSFSPFIYFSPFSIIGSPLCFPTAAVFSMLLLHVSLSVANVLLILQPASLTLPILLCSLPQVSFLRLPSVCASARFAHPPVAHSFDCSLPYYPTLLAHRVFVFSST